MAGPTAPVAEKSRGGHAVIVKSVLVTGASTGIGEACALRLDRLGHRVYAGVRREDDARRLRQRGSERLVPVILDVTDQAQVDAVAKQIAADGGSLDGLVNNAGIALGGPLEYLPIETWREQLDVNVLGPVAVTKAVLPFIREARGRIVFIGSISGKLATMLMGPYGASNSRSRRSASRCEVSYAHGASMSRWWSLARSRPPFGTRVGERLIDWSECCLTRPRPGTPGTSRPSAKASRCRTGRARARTRSLPPLSTRCSPVARRPATW